MSGIQTNYLIAGNVTYFDDAALRHMAPEGQIVVCGEERESRHGDGILRAHVERGDKTRLEQIFATYDFACMIYVSFALTYGEEPTDEITVCDTLLTLARKYGVRRVLFLSSQESTLRQHSIIATYQRAVAEVIRHHAADPYIDVKLMLSPYLCDATVTRDYWHDIFTRLEQGQNVTIAEGAAEPANFIAPADLADYTYRVLNRWEDILPAVLVPKTTEKTFGELTDLLNQRYPNRVHLEKSAGYTTVQTGRGGKPNLPTLPDDRTRTDLFTTDHLDAAIAAFREQTADKTRGRRKKDPLSVRIPHFESIVRVIEIVLGAFVAQGLVELTATTVRFRLIDYRLIYVMLIAGTWGTTAGILASAFMVLSLLWAYAGRGISAHMLLFMPTRWFPFILLFVAAVICGYVHQKREDQLAQDEQEVAELKKQYDVLYDIYEDTLAYKNEYKQNLVESHDGFGHIFEVVQKLSATSPERIYVEAIPVMEDVLNNKSIAIYSIQDETSSFARLEVSSAAVAPSLAKSLELTPYRRILKEMETSAVWVNRDLVPDFPMYITGVRRGGHYIALIMLYHAEFGQMSQYYVNLIRVLQGLMDNFLGKAWDYEQLTHDRNYYARTNIARPETFRRQLAIAIERRDKRSAPFELLKLAREGRRMQVLAEMLSRGTRATDVFGIGPDDELYMIAAQVDDDSLPIVEDRFKQMGFQVSVCDADTVLRQMDAEARTETTA